MDLHLFNALENSDNIDIKTFAGIKELPASILSDPVDGINSFNEILPLVDLIDISTDNTIDADVNTQLYEWSLTRSVPKLNPVPALTSMPTTTPDDDGAVHKVRETNPYLKTIYTPLLPASNTTVMADDDPMLTTDLPNNVIVAINETDTIIDTFQHLHLHESYHCSFILPCPTTMLACIISSKFPNNNNC